MIEKHPIHPKGPSVSALIWGAWRSLDHAETDHPKKLAQVIEACCDMGITSFDHADIYGGYKAEAHFGAALKQSAIARENIQLISKFGIRKAMEARPENRIQHHDARPVHLNRSVDASLKALGTDYLDCILLHRPDPLIQAEDTARAVEKLIDQGKIRAFGVSNHSPSQFHLLQSALSVPLVTNQIECSVFHLTPILDGTLDQAQEKKARPMIWSPLAGGKIFAPKEPRQHILVEKMQKIAQQWGTEDIGRIALAWLLALPSRPLPILGTGRIERLRSYAKATEIKFDRQDWYDIYWESLGRMM